MTAIAGSERITVPVRPAAPPANARTRMLLEGPIVSTLARIGAPNVVVNVILIAVTASVDAFFVGTLGSTALAGLTLVFPLLMLMQQMSNSSMGASIASAVARAIGAGRRDDAATLVVQALIVGTGMAALFTTVVLAGGATIYRLMGGHGPALDAAVAYSTAIFAGAIVYWVLSVLTSAVRGAGHAAVLGVVYVGAELVHIALVPLLVFGVGPLPGLGATGAGLATITSFALSSLVLAWYVLSGRTAITMSRQAVRVDRRLIWEIVRVGGPMSLQPLLANLTLALLTGFVGPMGPTALAAFGTAVRLEYVLNPIAFGLGAGVLAMVGTSLGAGRVTRAIRATWIAAALAAAVTGAVGLVAVIFPGLWIGFFSADPAVHAIASGYLRIVGLAYLFQGLGLTIAFAFQAAARPLWVLLAITGRAVLVAVGGFAVIRLANGGLTALAFVAAGGLAFYGITLAIAFRAGRWRTRALKPLG